MADSHCIYQPTVYKNSTDDEKKAAQQYVDKYGGTIKNVDTDKPTGTTPPDKVIATPPELTMAIAAPPAFIAQPPPPGTTPSNDSVDLRKAYKIDLGALSTAETTVYGSVKNLVDSYERLKSTVMAAVEDPSAFGQTVGTRTRIKDPSAGTGTTPPKFLG